MNSNLGLDDETFASCMQLLALEAPGKTCFLGSRTDNQTSLMDLVVTVGRGVACGLKKQDFLAELCLEAAEPSPASNDFDVRSHRSVWIAFWKT